MTRLETLLMATAKRADDHQNPVDGDFFREHNVSAEESYNLVQLMSVGMAAMAVASEVNVDFRNQIILVGTGGLTGIPASISRFALDTVRISQLQERVRERDKG